LTGPNEVRPLLHTRFDELTAEVSSDGRWAQDAPERL
jgi:hypothetical protein